MSFNLPAVAQCFDSRDRSMGDTKPNENHKHVVCRECSASTKKTKIRLHELQDGLIKQNKKENDLADMHQTRTVRWMLSLSQRPCGSGLLLPH